MGNFEEALCELMAKESKQTKKTNLKHCYICDCWVQSLSKHNKTTKHLKHEVSYFWSENPIDWDKITPEDWKLQQE